MVLAFTEEQKKKIELRGMTVIEFKRRSRKMSKTVDEALQILKELADKIVKAWNVFKDAFLEAVDGVRVVVEVIRDCYHYPTSVRYRIVKIFSICTGTNISFGWKLTWKIKRWLARRYC